MTTEAGPMATAAAKYAIAERLSRECRVDFETALYHVKAVWPRTALMPTTAEGVMEDLIKVTGKAIKRIEKSQERGQAGVRE